MAQTSILDVLDSLMGIARLATQKEIEKNKLQSTMNHQRDMQEERLLAQEKHLEIQQSFNVLNKNQTDIRNRIGESVKNVSEYGVALSSLGKIDELDRSMGGPGFTEDQLTRHKDDLMGYSTDYEENKSTMGGMKEAFDYNTKLLGAINRIEGIAVNDIAKIGTGLETLGVDYLDKVLD